MLKSIHHIAIIASNFELSKAFYTDFLGLEVEQEVYREERDSFKCDLSLNGRYVIELFSFPNPPKRVSRPEAAGLRHLAFEVESLENVLRQIVSYNSNQRDANLPLIQFDEIRVDEFTGKRFFFAFDPDELPIEFYEV